MWLLRWVLINRERVKSIVVVSDEKMKYYSVKEGICSFFVIVGVKMGARVRNVVGWLCLS